MNRRAVTDGVTLTIMGAVYLIIGLTVLVHSLSPVAATSMRARPPAGTG